MPSKTGFLVTLSSEMLIYSSYLSFYYIYIYIYIYMCVCVCVLGEPDIQDTAGEAGTNS